MKQPILILIFLISNYLLAQKPLYYEKLNDFKNGYALVQIGNKKGFIDTNGNLIGQLDVSQQTTAVDGTRFQGKSIYINQMFGMSKDGVRKFTGEYILRPEFNIQAINSFYLIKDSKNLIKPIYNIMNQDGEKVYSITLDKLIKDPIYPISNELIGIKDFENENSKYAVKSLNSNFRTDYIYNKFRSLKNGFIKARRYSKEEGKYKWGFLNGEGKEAIDFIYTSEPSDFSENKAVVENTNKLFGYIDTKNKIVLEPQFIEAYKFINGKAVVRIYRYKRMGNQPNYGYRLINTKGEILFDFGEFKIDKKLGVNKFDIIENNNLIKLKSGTKISLFNIDNLKIKQTPYNRIGRFDSNLALVTFRENKERKMGYINEKGELVFYTEKKNQF